MASREKRRLVLYSWILHLPMTLHGTVASTCKLLRILPNRHIVSFIMELVRNRSFTLTPSNGAQSRIRSLKNGVPQGSVLAPLLFNINTHDLLVTVARTFVYADNLAILHYAEDWQPVEGTLTQDDRTWQLYHRTYRNGN